MKFRPRLECLTERIVPDANGAAPDPQQPPANPAPADPVAAAMAAALQDYNALYQRVQDAAKKVDDLANIVNLTKDALKIATDLAANLRKDLDAELAKDPPDQDTVAALRAAIAAADQRVQSLTQDLARAYQRYTDAFNEYQTLLDQLVACYNCNYSGYGLNWLAAAQQLPIGKTKMVDPLAGPVVA